jgi:hypothetical protein
MSIATDMVTAYLEAERALLLGKEARIGDRVYRSEDLAELRRGRHEWEARAAAEARPTTPRIGGLTFAVARLD